MRYFVTAALAALLLLTGTVRAEVIHQQRSLYRNILVEESSGRRCLSFRHNQEERNQSCVDLTDPKLLVFPYVRMLMGSLLLNPAPARVLVIGLGGGTIPVTLHELFPAAEVEVVEIDEAVLAVARRFFDFKEGERLKVVIEDARVYAKRARQRGETFDLILLDAFTGDYIPEHLLTREFLEEIRSLLTPAGVLGANTFSSSQLYHHESATYSAVFSKFFNFRMPDTANRIILSSRATAEQGELPTQAQLLERARALQDRLLPYGVELTDFPAYMDPRVDWDTSARVLTDQYSPANLLNQ